MTKRLAATLLAFLLSLTPALAALAIDGTPVAGALSGAASTTCASPAFTNALSNSIIVALFDVTNATSSTVSSVSGGGLTWTKRTNLTGTTNVFNAGSVEEWWALAPTALTSQVITATLSLTTSACGVIVYAVNGANTTTPFDVNGSLPAKASDVTGTATAPTVSGISTTNANTMLVAFFGLPGNAGSVLTTPTGFTLITNTNGFSGSPNFVGSALQANREIVAASQSGITVAYGSTIANWLMIVDAIQAAGGGGGAGKGGSSLMMMGVTN